MSKLVVLTEGIAGRAYELKVDRTTVGRLEDNAFQIADPSVSSHHCEILLRGTEIVVKDLNSTNGTFLNGQKVTEAVIKSGQTLRLGVVEMRLEGGTPASSPTTSTKKSLDQTRLVPQGVKLDELEQGTKGTTFGKESPFAKKSNKATMIFLWVFITLGVIGLGFLIYAFFLTGQSGQ